LSWSFLVRRICVAVLKNMDLFASDDNLG